MKTRVKRTCYLIKFLVICWLVSVFTSLSAQQQKTSFIIPAPSHLNPNKWSESPIILDTSEFQTLFHRFENEVTKRGYMNLDTVRHYGHMAIRKAQDKQFNEGLIWVYIGFGWGYVEKNLIDSSIYYYLLAINKSLSLHNSHLTSQAYLNYAWALLYTPDNNGAIRTGLTSYALAKQTQDTSLLILTSSKLGRIYSVTGNLPEAYKYYTESIRYCKQFGDTTSLLRNYFLGISMFPGKLLGKSDKAYVAEVLSLKDHIKDTESLYHIYFLASNYYYEQNKYDSVIYYSWLLLPLSKKLNRFPNCLQRIANVYTQTGQLDSARHYMKLIMDDQKQHNTFVSPVQYLTLGNIESKSGNYNLALEYYKAAESKINNSPLQVQELVYKALYEYYNSSHQVENAFYYLKKYKIISDSILNYQNHFKDGIEIMELEAAEMEDHIDSLAASNSLQAVVNAKQRQERNILYFGICITIAILGLGFNRYRKNKSNKARQAITHERLRISRDLHDEVGATLSGLAMYSHIAREQIKKAQPENVDLSLLIMQTSAGEMVNKLSDIVWLMNPEQDSILKLFERLEEYARQIASTKNMQVKIDLPSDISQLNMPLETRRNIYLFCKEAINNAVKYSDGSLLALEVKVKGDKILFSIKDNGIGFDEISVKRGNGLNNMKKRADEIGGFCSIQSKPYKGAQIELEYKIT